MPDGGLESVEAIVERRQSMLAEGNDNRLIFNRQDG
jgi:hypothetical protein